MRVIIPKKIFDGDNMKIRSKEYGECNLIGKRVEILRKAQKIKQNANSVKIRSFEIADKAKKNKEFADSLYYEIKENPNSSS